MPVTLQDIAREAGVSVPTVSRALRGQQKQVWQSMSDRVERIRRIAHDMGYRPNAAARSTRTGRTRCITLVAPMSHGGGYLPRCLLAGLQQELLAQDLHMSLAELPTTAMAEDVSLSRLLRETLSDGMLVTYTRYRTSDVSREILDAVGVPYVWINDDWQYNAVRPDDQFAGEAAARLLIERGAKKLAYVQYRSPTRQHVSVRERLSGFQRVADAHGLEVDVLTFNRDLDREASVQLLVEYYQSNNPARHILAYEDIEARVAATAAARVGWKLYEDLELVAISADRVDSGLLVDTIHNPMGDVAKAGLRMLLELLDGEQTQVPSQLVKAPYVKLHTDLIRELTDWF